MNIWIFNHHAQGPNLPGGTRHYDLAKQLIKRGHKVTIFATGFHYTLLKETVNYDENGFKIQTIDGVKFVWIKTFPYQKNNWKRMVNILSYAWNLNFLIPKLELENPDIIIGTTVHPFAPIIAYKFSKKSKVPFIFEIRDLWPQSFIDMGIWEKGSLVAKVFKAIEKYTVKRADSIIILSPKTEDYLNKEYDYNNTVYIPNGVDLSKNIEDGGNNNTIEFLRKIKNSDKFLCLFSGAIVKTNSINILIEAAQKLSNINNIYFALVGKGIERDFYEKQINEKKLKNIAFLDPVNKELVPKLLSFADVLLLVQGNIQWGSSNKLFDYLSAKKPIVTSLYAKHNDIVENIKCGYSAGFNDSDDLADKVGKIYKLPEKEKKQMGENAYNYVSNHHNISLLAEKLEKLCVELINNV